MEARIRYIWKDEDNVERITKEPPIDACRGMLGGTYTPEYEKVVLIPIKKE